MPNKPLSPPVDYCNTGFKLGQRVTVPPARNSRVPRRGTVRGYGKPNSDHADEVRVLVDGVTCGEPYYFHKDKITAYSAWPVDLTKSQR